MTLREILRTTAKFIEILQINDIKTVKDFLSYIPRTYETRGEVTDIQSLDLQNPNKQSVLVQIIDKKLVNPRSAKKLFEITVQDINGHIAHLQYYNAMFQVTKLEKNKRYTVIGKPADKKGKIIFYHPEAVEAAPPESLSDIYIWSDKPDNTSNIYISASSNTKLNFGNSATNQKTGRIFPIYSEMMGIKPAWFADKIYNNIWLIDKYFMDHLPKWFVDKYELMDLADSMKELHYPTDFDKLNSARYRIYFEKMLKVQINSLLNKKIYQWQEDEATKYIYNRDSQTLPDRDIVKEFLAKLPFELTPPQKICVKEIIENLHSNKPMLRLMQWDVWSGKTIVAAIAAYYAIRKFGGQVAFLSPIEVLAHQHYNTLSKLFYPLGINVKLLTWSVTKSNKDKLKSDLYYGSIDIVTWTHAIMQDDVSFKNLRLVVIDEQHKFGVKQRWWFKQFHSPHILQMTATPIPRSLALAFFAEFSVSIIDQLPAGRKPIHTKVITAKDYIKLKPWILDRVSQGQNIYIVVPLVNESETLDGVKSAITEYQEACQMFGKDLELMLGKSNNVSNIPNHQDIYISEGYSDWFVYSPYIWLMHGKLKASEKTQVMQDFKSGKVKILVSTTVIEVGVDVPHATIMIIKNAERFGLSQLHQLRGRVGRSDIQSYCFLESTKKDSDRLQAMEETTDGFKLAEIDMKLRGAGEIMWFRQSGQSDIPLEILSDINFVHKVQDAAQELIDLYPKLDELPWLREEMSLVGGQLLV